MFYGKGRILTCICQHLSSFQTLKGSHFFHIKKQKQHLTQALHAANTSTSVASDDVFGKDFHLLLQLTTEGCAGRNSSRAMESTGEPKVPLEQNSLAH